MAEVELDGHRDAKKLSRPDVDPKLSQQKRREYLLEWQKSRRDELVDKLRSLDDSEASESEGEEVDFLEEVDFKGRIKRKSEIDTVDATEKPIENANLVIHGHGKGRGGGSNGSLSTSTVAVEQMEVILPVGRGRGREQRKNQVGSIADADLDWRVKKPETPAPLPSVPVTKDKEKRHGFRRKRPTPYGIMLSEWLVDIPEDFERDWIGLLCPVGKRCIVVACRGRTRVYTRRNDYLGQFSSCLPGGSNSRENNLSGSGRRGLTILDCLWSDKAQVFYVLDLICWNSYSVNDCPTDFRHFFLSSKFAEKPELLESSERNVVPFQPLPYFRVSSLADTMSTGCPTFTDEIDGVIFYHKDVFYLPQVTPLVLWVHLSDMESVLSVGVNPDLLARERVRHDKARYYLAKPNYAKKNMEASDEAGYENNADEPCDENGLPLG